MERMNIGEPSRAASRCASLAPIGGVMKMGCWFCDSPKYEPDSHACAKEHGKPGKEVKFWLGSIWPERDIPPFVKK